jgi:hypothetical protein
MKPDDLNYFCQKIISYNQKMAGENSNMRAIPCYNSTVFNQRIPGGVMSYLLFERPTGGFKLSEICTPHCAKDRVCRYMLKDFTKGWLKSILLSQESTDALDVNFIIAQNGFFYGKVPSVKKDLNATKDDSIRNVLAKNDNDEPTEDNNRHFITLAYPKAFSPESITAKPVQNEKLKMIKNKQLMVQFGKFLIDMYKGLDNSTNTPAPLPDDSFNPTRQFKNLTDTFLSMNTEKDGNFSKFRPDEYFGVKSDFIQALKAFIGKTLTTQKGVKAMDNMLKDSFYEFIYKTVTFDVESKIQFDKIETMLQHKFLVSKPKINQVRSDTSFEKAR